MFTLIKFENNNCVPCKNMGEYLDSKYDIPYEVVKVFENPEKAMEHNVRTVPVLLWLNDGVECGRVIGFDPVKLDKLMNEIINFYHL